MPAHAAVLHLAMIASHLLIPLHRIVDLPWSKSQSISSMTAKYIPLFAIAKLYVHV